MNLKKALPYLFLLVLAVLVLVLKRCKQSAEPQKPVVINRVDDRDEPKTARGLNRTPSAMYYSKHARCRMGCRHIDESEVMEILRDGKINYRKSELNGDDCRKKYAVEGISHDNQRLRIIFAPCGDEMTVVTCIDLGTEWPCDCGEND
ncbi:MAG: DUF4258 domain-containing protein [Filimonas sp.]|nr:DUF4258 domain-containing protein [Filimonas sp.]